MQPISQAIGRRGLPPSDRSWDGRILAPGRGTGKGTNFRSTARGTVRTAVSPRREFHLLERSAAEEAVGIGERLEDLEVVVALPDEKLHGFPRSLDRRGEVARLALKFGRLERPVRDDYGAVEPVDVAPGAERVLH